MQRFTLDPTNLPASLASVFRAAFPSYNGRKFDAEKTESVSITGTYWDGGSRSTYALVELSGGSCKRLPNDHPFFDRKGVEGTERGLWPGVAVVEHSIFCGKDLGLTVFLCPVDFDRLCPTPDTSDLTDKERRVLAVFRGIKSAYRPEYLTREGFSEALRDKLASAGYLKVARNGATQITTKGRNACEGISVH